MKIYVGHSRNFDFKKELYEPLRNSKLNKQVEIFLPHEKGMPYFDSKEGLKIFDFMLAEVSLPSIGLGMELAWADLYKIPIIAVVKKGTHISSNVKQFATHFLEYSSSDEFVAKIEKIITESINQ